MTLIDDEDIKILDYAAAKHMKPFEREAWGRLKARLPVSLTPWGYTSTRHDWENLFSQRVVDSPDKVMFGEAVPLYAGKPISRD